MLLAGLTGGIASGKSLVSNIFRSLGAHIIDADVIARELIRPGRPEWHETVEKFGRSILLEDGSINRRLLGDIVFKDSEKREILNKILHPKIFEEAERQRMEIEKEYPDAIIIFDAALLIETGSQDLVDVVILVCSDEELQIRRLTERDGLNRQEAMERIKAQMPAEAKKQFADYIIDTSGSQEDVEKQVTEIYHMLKARMDGNPSVNGGICNP